MTPVTGSLRRLLLILFSVFVFATTCSIAVAQIAYAASLAVFIVLLAIEREFPRRRIFNGVLVSAVGYVLWMVVSALVNATPVSSLLILKEEWLFGIVPIGLYLCRDADDRDRLVTALAAGVLVFSIYGLIQHFTGATWLKDHELVKAPLHGYRIAGTFSHRNTFAHVFGVASLFLLTYGLGRGWPLRLRFARLVIPAAVLGLVATIFTYSRGAALSVLAGAVVLGVVRGRRFRIGTAVVIVAALSILVVAFPGVLKRYGDVLEREASGEYTGSRMFIWSHSLTIIGDNPVFGVGQGNFLPAYREAAGPGVPDFHVHAHAHNDLLNVAAIAGIPAALFFAAMWLLLLRLMWLGMHSREISPAGRMACQACLIGSAVFLVSSLMEATFADEEVRQLLMFIWAAGLSGWYNLTGGQNDPLDA